MPREPHIALRPGGPLPEISPARKGWEIRRRLIRAPESLPSEVEGAALFPLHQPDLGIHRYNTTMSNEIKETEPTNLFPALSSPLNLPKSRELGSLTFF